MKKMNKENIQIKDICVSGIDNFKKNNLLEAENLFKKVLNIKPNHEEANFFLGLVYANLNSVNKAKEFFAKTIEINVNHIDAHYNLGIIFDIQRQYEKSIEHYKKAIDLNSNFAIAYNNLGLVFYKTREYEKAIECYNKAIDLNPNSQNHVDAYNNLGNVYKELEQYENAIACYKKAISIKPNFAMAHNNLGLIFYHLKKFENAKNSYQNSIEINPNYERAHNNLGILFKELGQYKKAISQYEKVIQINPNHADAHFGLGILLILLSNFEKGFKEYEWRKKLPRNLFITKDIESLEWQGEDLTNKRILILSEQGTGDIIQFSRYLYLLQDQYSANIIFRTKKNLIHLFSKNKFKLISDEEPVPQHDFHKLLLSLPQMFYQKKKTFPKQINFIPKNENIALKWKNKLKDIKGFKVGINWQGRKSYGVDHLRSIPLFYYEKLFTIEKINFINLQKGFGTEQIKDFKYKDKLYDFSSEIDNGDNAFEDTIGILQNLDLIITSDTALPHLSSTLGIKTWVLLHYSPDWRWFLKSKDSVWYKNLTLYRQEKVDNWNTVFDSVKKDLVVSLKETNHNTI